MLAGVGDELMVAALASKFFMRLTLMPTLLAGETSGKGFTAAALLKDDSTCHKLLHSPSEATARLVPMSVLKSARI